MESKSCPHSVWKVVSSNCWHTDIQTTSKGKNLLDHPWLHPSKGSILNTYRYTDYINTQAGISHPHSIRRTRKSNHGKNTPFHCLFHVTKIRGCSWNNSTGSTTDSLWFSEIPKEDRLTTGRSVPGNDGKQQKSLFGKGASISEASVTSTQQTCGENICFWQITFQPTILHPRLKALTWPGNVIGLVVYLLEN